jgi:hypothetical protein
MPSFTTAEAWLNAQIKQPSQSVQTFNVEERMWRDYYESWVVRARPISRLCPLDNHLNLGTSVPARHSLGELEKLPNELIVLVLLSVDIPSLTVFRRVNRRAMQIVDSVPEYATLIKRTPEVISAVLSMEANAFDLKHLYNTVREPKCSFCHRNSNDVPANMIHLIDCRRACTTCVFDGHPDIVPCIWDYAATSNDSGKTLELDQQLPETQFPSILSFPLFPSSAEDVPDGLRGLRVRLFDRQTVSQKGYVVADDNDDLMDLALRLMTVMVSWPF